MCALFASAQRTRLAESLRLYDCGDKSRVASRRLPIERFGPILLNITASGTTAIYLFPRASPVFPRYIAGEVAISRYRACLGAILFQLPARTWKRSFDVSFNRSFGTCLFVLLLGNDLSKDRDATSSLDESRLESLSWWKFGFGEPQPGVSRRDRETQFPESRIRKLVFTLAESGWFSVEGCPGESRRDRETEKMGSTVERAKVSVARQPTPETSSQTLTSRPEAKSSKSRRVTVAVHSPETMSTLQFFHVSFMSPLSATMYLLADKFRRFTAIGGRLSLRTTYPCPPTLATITPPWR